MYTLNFFTDELFLQCNEILLNVLFLCFFSGILDVITEPDKFLEELVKSLP